MEPLKHFDISGPLGRLESILMLPTAWDQKRFAIVCHPHPLFEGTMHNKVVHTLCRMFRDLGIASVRFNFRGVGKSAGVYGETEGESEDLRAVVAWQRAQFPQARLTLAGFSFGSYISARLANDIQPEALICVAPPVTNFDFQSLPEFKFPWWVIQGDQDEVIDAQAVFTWIKNHPQPPHLIHFLACGHFFHGRLTELHDRLSEALRLIYDK